MDPQSIEFSEEEIQDELARLGYRNVPEEKLREFKKGKLYINYKSTWLMYNMHT